MEITKLNERQRKFCENYVRTGNATRSYMDAYNQQNVENAGRSAVYLMKQDYIREYIRVLSEAYTNDKIADMNECLELLTEMLRNPNNPNADRIKCMDMRFKTLGAYLDKKQVDANVNAQVVITDDYTTEN